MRGEAKEMQERSEKVTIKVRKLKQLQRQLLRDIRFLTVRAACYYNRKRSVESDLKEGEPVYLIRRNIKTKRPVSKLDFIKLGPF